MRKKANVGVLAGAFDIIHPGYIRLFKDAKSVCEYLIIALHVDPSLHNPKKLPPIFSVLDRIEILSAIRYIDEVIPYVNERELDLILLRADLRINGSDHEGISSRPTLSIPTYYHKRDHSWSTTRVKEMIRDSFPK